ncbi:GGDEF domain-containing protein [Shewanella sp. OPT22]|nr:GGDEF domain-containing protein [Shewanella sp. OPT22]
MFTSKIYQLFLLLCLGALWGWLYVDANREFNTISAHQTAEYNKVIGEYDSWAGNGEELYRLIQKQIPLRFFQFIDKENRDNNFTRGSILPSNDHFLSSLISKNPGTTSQLSTGRLQVKFNLQHSKQELLNKLFSIGLYSFFAYIVIAFVAYTCMSINKQLINKLVEIISTYTEQRPSSINNSFGLPKNFSPVENALRESRKKIGLKLQVLIEENRKLDKDAYSDSLTGLSNTLKFTEALNSLKTHDHNGVFLLLKASELSQINQSKGRLAGDSYLKQIAQTLAKNVEKYTASNLFRISSAEFAAIIPHAKFSETESLLKKIKGEFELYQQTLKSSSIAHFALIPYKPDSKPIALLSLADAALSIAQTMGPNCYHAIEKADNIEQVGDNRWKITIENLIKRKSLVFYQQPIQSCRASKNFYQELLTRFKNSEGKLLPTAAVIAMAERYDLITVLDKLILTSVVKMLRENPQLTGSFGVNISTSSALHPSFQAWMKDFFKQYQKLATKLVLEVNETGIQANTTASANFVRLAHSLGLKVSIEHFGMGLSAFRFFKEVRPDFIKLDGSFTKQIETNDDNKFFVKMMVDLAKRIGVTIIATNIESQSEKIELEQLLVDGLQGFYIASPKLTKAA